MWYLHTAEKLTEHFLPQGVVNLCFISTSSTCQFKSNILVDLLY